MEELQQPIKKPDDTQINPTEGVVLTPGELDEKYKVAANAPERGVSAAEKGRANEAIQELTLTLERDSKILDVIKKTKSVIAATGPVEVGTPDFNDIVESLRNAGETHNPESLAKKIRTGDFDGVIETGYKNEMVYREELIRKNQDIVRKS